MAKNRVSAGRLLAIALVGGGALTLLFWAKLRLMTQVPRAAYAEPQGDTTSDTPSDAHAGPAPDAGSTSDADGADAPERDSPEQDSPEWVDAADDLPG